MRRQVEFWLVWTATVVVGALGWIIGLGSDGLAWLDRKFEQWFCELNESLRRF